MPMLTLFTTTLNRKCTKRHCLILKFALMLLILIGVAVCSQS